MSDKVNQKQDVEQTNVEKGKKRAGMKSKATRSPRRKHVNVEKGKKMNYLTTSVLNINGSDFLYCKDIMRMGEFDWCQAVVDDIREKVDRWRKNRDKATPLVQGCIAFIMIYYLDNLECDDKIADFVSIPRARFFTSAIIEKIASADRESHDGYLSYGKLPLRERIGSCYANIGDGTGGQGHVLESVTSSAGFLYGKAAGVVKIHPAAKAKRDHIVKEKGVKHHDKHRSPPADDNTKRSKSKGQSASKTMEYRHIPYGFLHLQPLLRGLVDHISDGQQKMVFLSALELHDNDVDEAIIKINEAHKDIEEAQQKFASEIKHMFGDLVGHSLNTESPRDIHRKRRAERPLGGSSLNVKRKSQIPRDVSPVHIDSGDDCPEIVVERSPQSSAGQSSFEQQEVAHAPSDTHVQHEVEQTVTVESVHEEVIHAELHTDVQHEGTELGVDARAQQEILTPATDTPVQHEPTQPEATTIEHVEVELPAPDTTDEVIRESDTCVQRSGVFDGDFNYEDWNEVGNILRELNEDPTQVSLRKEYDIKEAVALTGEKQIILFENYTSESQYDENTVPSLLDERLKAHDLLNASLVFLPVHSRGHWTVYCVNMIHHQIDILDSYPWSSEVERNNYHASGLPYIDVPKQVLVNDCGFFVMLFLEHYDGERRKFDVPIIPEKGTQYRAELMYYLFFHKMNEARGPSLELFELLAPGNIEHNVIEGTQQIIDSSDATKVGVASRDVEKDDVASRDD
ncbi:hypothetical protein GUJ93_ZPchr0006g45998 [Zizania palustris]|uniref:Ubiquitin-like protease family profile domain-containing protein n=1 Tax=Zizania palustris TaxID=103762 RepID=A0A8J5SVW0_ZIZPA|nr:hypothetical protein GUJ93_ZPchr0006g45998 [Zizania palustris]